jgi:hypothetical protein
MTSLAVSKSPAGWFPEQEGRQEPTASLGRTKSLRSGGLRNPFAVVWLAWTWDRVLTTQVTKPSQILGQGPGTVGTGA